MNKEKKGKQPFGRKDKLGYLFGDFGNDFTFLLSSSFLMKFYTDVMGVPAAIVGTVMMIARFVDAFTDVAMGRICDRSPIKAAGKFKPWILRMSIPVAVSSFLIYQSGFSGYSMAFKVVWLTITYIVWGSFFYTSINIPYGSMASAISAQAGDRQSLSTFRSIGGTLAGLIVGVGVPMLAYQSDAFGNMTLDGRKFTMIAGVFSILAIVCYLLCYVLVTERVHAEGAEEAGTEDRYGNVFQMIKKAVQNRALISIIAASVFMLLAQLTMQQMANYVYPNYYGNTLAQSVSTIVMVLAMFLAAAFAKPCSERFGKAEVAVVSNLLAAGICGLLFFIRPGNVWVYVALIAVCWLGLGMFSMVNWSLITDVIDYAELKNGIREDGSVYALYSFARKLGQAAAAGVSGGLLSWIGYTEATAFEPSVTEGIYNISTLLPAVGFFFLSMILQFWYPLHKRQVEENAKALEKRKSL